MIGTVTYEDEDVFARAFGVWSALEMLTEDKIMRMMASPESGSVRYWGSQRLYADVYIRYVATADYYSMAKGLLRHNYWGVDAYVSTEAPVSTLLTVYRIDNQRFIECARMFQIIQPKGATE